MPQELETCLGCGYQVSEGQSAPATCPGCGKSNTFTTEQFPEKGEGGEGGKGFHGVPTYAQQDIDKPEEQTEPPAGYQTGGAA